MIGGGDRRPPYERRPSSTDAVEAIADEDSVGTAPAGGPVNESVDGGPAAPYSCDQSSVVAIGDLAAAA